MRGLLYMPNNNVKIFNITYLILSRYFVTEFSRISEKKVNTEASIIDAVCSYVTLLRL